MGLDCKGIARAYYILLTAYCQECYKLLVAQSTFSFLKLSPKHQLLILPLYLYAKQIQYLLFRIKLMKKSLRLQCQSQIVRPPKEQYIETYNLPYEKRVEAIPYYSRRKRQLKAKNAIYNHQQNQDASTDKLSYDLSVQHQNRRDRGLADMITEVSIEPVFNENKFTSFNPQLYPLSQSQKVKVVDQKYFSLQNYYNYICAMKSQEQIFRLAEETQKRAKEVLEKKNKRATEGKYIEAGVSVDFDDKRGPIIKETRKIKGSYESRFDPSGRFTSEQMVSKIVDLSPIHFDYQPGRRNNGVITPFDLKEAQREQRIQEIVEKSRRR